MERVMQEPGNDSLHIDAETLAGWQSIVDLMAEICEVPAGLVMRVTGNEIEVFVSSHTKDNPYRVGDAEELGGSGLYCEHVIQTRSPLHVPNALAEDRWSRNPDIKLGMISYHGYPILAPDGDVFGTICVLDAVPRILETPYERLIERFKDHIEDDLISITRAQRLEQQNRDLTAALIRVKALEGVLPTCQYCKKIRLPGADEGDPASWIAIEAYIRERSNVSFSHGICPDCMRKRHGDL